MSVLDTIDMFSNREDFKPLQDMIESIMNLDDAKLKNDVVDVFSGIVEGAFPATLQERMINGLVNEFKNERLNRKMVNDTVEQATTGFTELIDSLQPSTYKRQILENLFEIFSKVFERAAELYNAADLELPIQLEEGAQVPTYAHDTDAAADLYAADTVVVPAHSIGNMIRTGVHIGLPDGWVAYIIPRSSIGAKTPLRLSNSVGCIDSHYRGPLGVLYDNISDLDYTINAGDRIAQLLVMPSYRFHAQVVDTLDETDRGSGGFGSTGT